MELRPNKAEELFLTLGYNRFYDLCDEVMNDDFWNKEPWYRFSKVANGYAIYSELLTYEPFRHVLGNKGDRLLYLKQRLITVH